MISDIPHHTAHSIQVAPIIREIPDSEGKPIVLKNNTSSTIYYYQSSGSCPTGYCGIRLNGEIVPQKTSGSIAYGASITLIPSVTNTSYDYGLDQNQMYDKIVLSPYSFNTAKLGGANVSATSFFITYTTNNNGASTYQYGFENILSNCYSTDEASSSITYTIFCLTPQ